MERFAIGYGVYPYGVVLEFLEGEGFRRGTSIEVGINCV